jgi:Holliday junction resolvase RusA-like endonuclease
MTRWIATLDGLRVISKKNSKRIVRAGRFAKLLPSEAYERFEAEALRQLAPLRPAEPFTFPYTLIVTLHRKGKLDIDTCNAVTSLNDTLQAAGIVANDSQCLRIVADKKLGASDFLTEIEIIEQAE